MKNLFLKKPVSEKPVSEKPVSEKPVSEERVCDFFFWHRDSYATWRPQCVWKLRRRSPGFCSGLEGSHSMAYTPFISILGEYPPFRLGCQSLHDSMICIHTDSYIHFQSFSFIDPFFTSFLPPLFCQFLRLM